MKRTKPLRTNRKPSRKVHQIADILPRTLTQGNLAKKVEACSALPLWPEIVGEEIAAISAPEKILAGKVLVVRVIDAVWAQELSMRKEEILDEILRRGLGAVLEDIQFYPGDPRQFNK